MYGPVTDVRNWSFENELHLGRIGHIPYFEGGMGKNALVVFW